MNRLLYVSISEVKHILLIEPDNGLRAVITSTLEGHGYSVMGSASEKDALYRIKNQRFACVIVGLDAGHDLIQLIEAIRAGNGQPNQASPLLVVASSLTKEIVEKLAGKVQGAVLAPFAPEALLARVVRVIA